MSLVNVFTEWAPLEEVIVGDCLNFNIDLLDPTFEMVYYENLKSQRFKKSEQYQIDKRRFEERVEDLNNLQKTLEDLGIKVRRPKPLSKAIPFKTPWWKAICTAPDSPRDTVMCIGDTIIETPPTIRGRYFENTHFRDIFMEYFKSGARWVSPPRPSLQKETIDPDNKWVETFGFTQFEEIDNRLDISFDAANCLKFGKDIIFNVGSLNHELGVIWLEQELPDFRIHAVRLADSHIDAVIAPLAPGKMIYNPIADKKRRIIDQLPEPLQKWDFIPMEDEDLGFCLDKGEIYLASQEGMFINLLSVDERRIIIQDTAVKTIKMLERNGFEPIPIRFNQGRLFSGGIHCCTVDVRRKEVMEDYFV